MDLKDFIKRVVEDIVGASEELSESLDREICLHSHESKHITFDIAVGYEEGKSNKKGISVVNIFGFELGTQSNQNNSLSNRIQFNLFVSDLNKKREKQRNELREMNNRR